MAEVVDEHRAALLDRAADQTITNLQADRLDHAFRVAEGVADRQRICGFVQQVDRERVELDEALDEVRNRAQQVLELENGHDPSPKIE
jgi:hypothetical protein